MKTVLAGDFGGTKCRFALVAEDLSVHCVRRVATSRDREEFLGRMDAAIVEMLAERPAELQAPTAAGFGVAGLVPVGAATVLSPPNLPLDGFPLAEHVARIHGLPSTLINDGRASAWGELLCGHARGEDPLLCLFFGTGIGIGLMVDGKPFAGADNFAGEIGHTIHEPGGRLCPCGGRGHFEAYCGGRAMEERAAAEIGPAPDGRWDVGKIRGHDSDAARAILADAERAATALVASACTLLNPRAVVLGGGVLNPWPELATAVECFTRAECRPHVTKNLRFSRSLGDSDAVLWGAAAAARAATS